jgi:hypothetical protein
MVCKKILPLLSEFHDEELDAETTVLVSQHMNQCAQCRAEYDKISVIKSKLQSLRGVQAPEYLHSLVQHRIAEMRQNTWRKTLRYELERRWSLIRTTERVWYITRALGTVMTAIIFFVISSTAISPLCLEVNAKADEREGLTFAYGKQVSRNVLANLGMHSSQLPQQQPIIVSRNNPAINDLYYVIFEEGNASTEEEDTLTVVAAVDPSGMAKIQNVIEYPTDKNTLIKFNEMISSAKYRPASQNGKAVASYIVMTYSTVSVSD